MLKPIHLLLIAAATATSLMAGLFYAWSCSVTPGFQRLTDASYITVMQSCNRAIQNPVFFAGFFGALVLLPLCTFLNYSQPLTPRFWLLLAASVCYIAGTFGVTVVGNVPMNELLDKFDLQSATPEAISTMRAQFEGRWNNLNMIRTLSSVLAVILVIIACLSPQKPD